MRRLLIFFILTAVVVATPFAQKREFGKVKTVVIDPGHGGAKPGAIGKHIDEKTIVLSVAQKLGKLINDNYPDVKVIYTRTTDVDIDLSARAHIANRAKADLFISIHANSHPTAGPSGMETWVVGLSQSKANMEIAKKENADILLERDYKTNSEYQGFDPNAPESYVLFAMYQNAYRDKSLTFAQYIQNQYKAHINAIDRGVKQAEFMVLYKTTMPSVLTEIGFISNPQEEAYMMSSKGQNTIAECLLRAFATYKAAEEGEPIPELTIDLPKDTVSVQPPITIDTAAKAASAATIAQTSQQETKPLVSSDTTVGAPYKVDKKTPETPADGQVAYRIQFMTLSRVIEKGSPELRGIDDFDCYTQGQYYYYVSGKFASMSDAADYLEVVRAKGFKDALVVAYLNGSRISLQQARKLTTGK